jgi:TonB family protein
MNMCRHVRRAAAIVTLACAAAHAADPATEKQQSLVKLRATIVKNISTPCGITPTQRIELKLLLQDNGYVRGISLVQSSGAPVFDAAVIKAIAGAQPYSLPADAAARKELQNLNLKFDAFSTPIPKCGKQG